MLGVGRPLVLATAAIVASFVVTLWLSLARLANVESQVYQVATIAEPGVVHLDAARSEVERMGLYVDEFIISTAGHLPVARASRELALAARDRMHQSLLDYERLQHGDDADLYDLVRRRLAVLEQATTSVLERTDAGDLEAARLGIAAEVLPGIERVSAMLKLLIERETDRGLRDLAAIRAGSRSANSFGIVCGSISIGLSLLATVIALRALAQAAARLRQVDEEHAARVASEDALHGRDQFLALAAHELRTPLTALAVAVQALGRGAERPASGLVSVVERQVGRMNELVEELMHTAQIDLGALALFPEPTDLTQLVRDCIASRAKAIEQSGSTVQLHGDEPVVGRWDAHALERAVNKLLANAIKFGTGNPIEIVVSREGGEARLVVEDRGLGITPDRIEAVFERYERGVSEKNYPGLGLGLYIARSIVEAHGGAIRAESGIAGGTRIVVDLPIGDGDTPGSVGEQALRRPS